MSKIDLNSLKPLSFLPAIIIMCLIFNLSGQSSTDSAKLSMEVTTTIVETTAEVLHKPLSTEEVFHYSDLLHLFVRKSAHFGLYFLLAIAFLFPLYLYGLRGIFLKLTTFLLCTLYACSDEFHQSLVAGRGPGIRDVLLDSFGVLCGILTVYLFHKLLKHRQ